jgi:hypothetical protein
VQTPYRYFIIESHSWLPGIIVFLPRPVLVHVLRFMNKFWPKQTSPDWRLLTIGEFSQMFPDAKIEREKSLGFVKSLMAIKAWSFPNHVPLAHRAHAECLRRELQRSAGDEFLDDTLFTIVDELLEAPVSFLLDPTCQSTVEPDQSGVLITHNNVQLIRIASAGPLRARVVRGDQATGLGWFSPSFGVRTATDQMLFEGQLDKSSTITINLL